MVGFVLGAVFGSPDPFTQVWIAAGVIPFAAVIAYLVVYRTNAFASDVVKTK